jgi:iron complex outermembrane receptor protein
MESRFNKLLIWVLTVILIFAGSQLLSAQTNQVRGVITEKSGAPLAGVNVIVKGTNHGAISDTNGNYTISSNKGDVLVFSFLGIHSTRSYGWR